MVPILILPGYGNSGALHWQTIWETKLPSVSRIDFKNWTAPVAREWCDLLHAELESREQPCVLVAHSLACLVVAQHIEEYGGSGIAGAFLVAPPDPRAAAFPKEITGFDKLAKTKFPMNAIVISSTDDPYSDVGFGAWCASAWGASHHSLEKAGHINVDSGFGNWADGLVRLNQFVQTLDAKR